MPRSSRPEQMSDPPPRMHLPTTDQEFALARANDLVRRLQDELAATNQEVLLLTLDLESRVAERTAQLTAVNSTLRQEIATRKKVEAEVRKLNEDLLRQADDLREANKELESFSYSVSHDLRAPLRHISGYLGILAHDARDHLTNEDLDTIANINRVANRMSKLIDDLLLFARTARQPLSVRNVKLNEVVGQIVESIEIELEAEDRTIEWKVGDLPEVTADPGLLRLALANLVSNAVKFTRNAPSARIEIGCEAADPSSHTIFVRDNGAGFDPAYSSKLFGVFQRLHSEKEFEGTGIGLANVQRIIHRHGGRVWADGEVDQGATFSFTLPK